MTGQTSKYAEEKIYSQDDVEKDFSNQEINGKRRNTEPTLVNLHALGPDLKKQIAKSLKMKNPKKMRQSERVDNVKDGSFEKICADAGIIMTRQVSPKDGMNDKEDFKIDTLKDYNQSTFRDFVSDTVIRISKGDRYNEVAGMHKDYQKEKGHRTLENTTLFNENYGNSVQHERDIKLNAKKAKDCDTRASVEYDSDTFIRYNKGSAKEYKTEMSNNSDTETGNASDTGTFVKYDTDSFNEARNRKANIYVVGPISKYHGEHHMECGSRPLRTADRGSNGEYESQSFNYYDQANSGQF